MGYYNRTDLPYDYALADAFTICDNYFCSVIGPPDPISATNVRTDPAVAGKRSIPQSMSGTAD
jgi:phospholipase C